MRQHSTVPLLAVILAAVLSRGKSFSQSLASHAICLPDTGMRLLLPPPLPALAAAFFLTPLSLVISSCHPTFSPHISPSLFSLIITSLALFLPYIHFLHLLHIYLRAYITSILLSHQFLSIFPPLTLSTFFSLPFSPISPSTSAHCCLSFSLRRAD